MRRFAFLAIAASGVALLVAAPITASAANNVLTVGSAGGAAVNVNDSLTSGLASGTNAMFTSTAGGSTGLTCTASSFTATVTSNPAAPGTATESLTAQTFSGCTSNVPGTSTATVTINNLPYSASVTDPAPNNATISGSLQATAVIRTVFGNVTCVYSATSISGTTSNTDNSLAFSGQQFTKKSGPSVCFANGFLTATYAQILDTTQSSQPVFTN